MNLAYVRTGTICLFAMLLQACGGGGGDGGGDPAPAARLRVSSTNVNVSATPGDNAPAEIVTLTIDNPQATGAIFFDITQAGDGVESTVLNGATNAGATLDVQFASTGGLANGTYAGTITAHACLDAACTDEIAGSPATIHTSYEISGTGTSTAVLDEVTAELVRYKDDFSLQTVTLASLTVSPRPDSNIAVFAETDAPFILDQQVNDTDPTHWSLQALIQPASQLAIDTYRAPITISVCYDPSCVRHVEGSPFTIEAVLTVDPATERGLEPLVVASRTALEHDVIDAEFSKSLNRIVMVSAHPTGALYVYDSTTGTEVQQTLPMAPTSVSVAPDGLTAAVGHNSLISVVDLAAVGQPGAPAPVTLNVSADVFDLVLDGNGFVHALPGVGEWVNVHSVEVATNIETVSLTTVRVRSHAVLYPSGAYMYTADNDVSPATIDKFDITAGPAALLYDALNAGGGRAGCGKLWINGGGTRLYTGCGDSLQTSTDQAQDLALAGVMPLSGADLQTFDIQHLDQSDALHEIALIEKYRGACETPINVPCFTHFATIGDDLLDQRALYSIRPMYVDGDDYFQRGLFVFHDALDGRVYMLSKLDDFPGPTSGYYVSIVQ